MGQQEWMTKWDQLAGPLGSHDPGQFGHGQYIPFFHVAFYNQAQRFRLHNHRAAGDGDALAIHFVADVNHRRPPAVVKVCQFPGHVCNYN